jgi:hypothetical protein
MKAWADEMSEHDETAANSVSTSRSRLRPGKNPATIGAIATILAAVIAGVFTLIASHGSGSGQLAPGVVTVLGPVPSGAAGAAAPSGPGGGESDVFLADLNSLKGPDSSDFADTVGGRTIVRAVGLACGDDATYSIPVSAKHFAASVGISDHSDNSPDATGVFSVFGDATLLGQVNLKVGQLAILYVSVTRYKVLQLGFSCPSGGINNGGDFGLARFTS